MPCSWEIGHGNGWYKSGQLQNAEIMRTLLKQIYVSFYLNATEKEIKANGYSYNCHVSAICLGLFSPVKLKAHKQSYYLFKSSSPSFHSVITKAI